MPHSGDGNIPRPVSTIWLGDRVRLMAEVFTSPQKIWVREVGSAETLELHPEARDHMEDRAMEVLGAALTGFLTEHQSEGVFVPRIEKRWERNKEWSQVTLTVPATIYKAKCDDLLRLFACREE